jgi:hypothetical protein
MLNEFYHSKRNGFDMKNILAIIAVLMLSGCAASIPQITETRDREITAPVPELTGVLTTEQSDTVIVAQKIIKHDTVVSIIYVPKDHKVYYNVKPDSVKVHVVDTVQVFRGHTDAELDAMEGKGIKEGAGGTLAALVIIALILFLLKK